MGIVVVGGHTRNIGKTTAVEQILRATADLHWTSIKITQFGHGVCSANGEPCDCDTGDHVVAVSEERNRDSGTDTSRMLLAGAGRVLWVRTRQGMLAEAMPRLRAEFDRASNVLVESNSILRFIRPALYIAVLDGAHADFKRSALRYLDRADFLLTPDGRPPSTEAWRGISPALLRGKPVHAIGTQLSPDLEAAIRSTCRTASAGTGATQADANSKAG